ncbi:MAG: DUF4836 family protein, partial [Bacteroidota bacterium]
MKQLFLFFLGVSLWMFFSSAVFGQKLLQYLPDDTQGIYSIHPQHYQKKGDLKELQELSLYQSGMELLGRTAGPFAQTLQDIIEHPADYGMDWLAPSYYYTRTDSILNYTSFLFELSDVSKFEQLLMSLTGGFFPIEEKEGYQMMMLGQENALAWSTGMAKLVMAQNRSVLSGDSTLANTATSSPTLVRQYIENAMEQHHFQSIRPHANVVAAFSEPAALKIWLPKQQEVLLNSASALLNRGGLNGPGFNSVLGLHGDYSAMHINTNFDRGQVVLDLDYFGDSLTTSGANGLYSGVDWNPTFAQYLSKKSLLAYVSMVMQPEEMLKLGQGWIDQMEGLSESQNSNERFGLFSHKRTAAEMAQWFRGDFLLLFNGVGHYPKIKEWPHTLDEDVQDTVWQRYPQFVMLFTCQDEKALEAFLQMELDKGELQQQGPYYRKVSTNEATADLYSTIHEGLFFLSNNLTFLQERVGKGYPKTEQLGAAHIDQMKAHPLLVYANIPKLMNAYEQRNTMSD